MFVDMEKENQKQEDTPNSLSNLVLNVPGCKRSSMVRGSKPQKKLIFNFNQIKGFESWVQGVFLNNAHGLHNRSIPKHLVSVDEMYLRLCLEAIHVSALKSSSCGVSINANPIYIQYLEQGSFGSSEVLRSSLDMNTFVIGFPVSSANGNEQCVLGSITESSSMLNILKSPLFQRLGPLSKEARLKSSMLDKKSFSRSNLTQPSGLGASPLSQKLGSDSLGLRNDSYKSDASQRSPVSIASAYSVFTDQSSQSLSTSSFQGMLQCTWKGGLPCFEFSIDDQKEIYVANAYKTDAPDDKSLDYVYSFHSKFSVPYDHLHGKPDIVGKMRVSTSLSLCPNNSKVAETEFVLFGVNEGQGGDFQINSRIGKRRRKLSKVMEVLKPNQTIKRRSPSVIFEERLENVEEGMNKTNLSQSGFLPELELAAVVVKDHIKDESHHQEEIGGGWGLKFLKKAGSRQNPSQNCEDCSTSIDIILPAGFHGRPATGNGGPSSILGRWKSGGCCDCGGWDIGCPLTILKSIPRKEDSLPYPEHSQKDCKSFDIFSEGSEQGTPVVKVTNVHEGLYYITFRASLPILQCFSIAVAMVHSQSPELRPKHVQM